MVVAYSHVLNVISKEARALVGTLRNISDTAHWLSDGFAFDMFFNGDPQIVLARARTAAAGIPADINVVEVEQRRKRLLVADMDSTIITCECLDELADFVGLKAKISAITERAMRGEIAFEGALKERVGMLKGLPLETLERVRDERIRLTPGARALTQTMKKYCAATRCLLVSGGFSFFADRVAQVAGFDEARANMLKFEGNILTGDIFGSILGREAKLAALEGEAARLSLLPEETLAVGDGANDLAMIERAGMGVAFHAKPKVAAAARFRIDHADLRGLLYLQGYRDDEIVT
jgi:phosphoserine phosphatase